MANNEQHDLYEQAAQWLQVLHEGHPSEEEMAAFDAWMTASDAHADTYAALSEQYYELDFLDPAALDLPSTPIDDEGQAETGKVLPFDSVALKPQPSAAVSAKQHRWFASFAVAASVAAVFVFSQSFFMGEPADLSSSVGEVAQHTLDDASTVHLNTDTQLQVRMTPTQRDIELMHGEAYFVVAKDTARPFVVHSGGAEVKALGTEFAVYNRDKGKTQVAVYESRVEVSHPHYVTTPLVVSAGEVLEFGPNIDQAVVSHLPSESGPSWREGRLVFNNMPLEDVIAVLNDYHSGRILLSDDLAAVPISGVFHDIDAVRILNDIIETQALASVRLGDRVIYVHR